MLEHITRALYYFEVHLLYASAVGFAAWILTSIRGGSATTKYWIWVATALNFILPLGAVLDKLGASHLSWASPLSFIGEAANGMSRGPAAATLGVVWLIGAILMFTRLCRRLWADHLDSRAAEGQSGCQSSALSPTLSLLADGVQVRFAESRRGPAVNGVLRPHISLPSGIDQLLAEPELNAVLVHELTHARRRDNLIRLVYEVGLCGLWFHPLVWITGSRLALYRELSCDEPVIRSAHSKYLVSALAKLANSEFADREIANPAGAILLQASASSFLSHRLSRLAAPQPERASHAAGTLLTAVFSAVIVAGVLGTVSHTACCFVDKHIATVTELRQPLSSLSCPPQIADGRQLESLR